MIYFTMHIILVDDVILSSYLTTCKQIWLIFREETERLREELDDQKQQFKQVHAQINHY